MPKVKMLRNFAAAAVMGLCAIGNAHAATVLITGSNRGIGLEFVKQYADKGWTVIATTRNPDAAADLKELAAKNNKIVIEQLDVIDDASVKTLAAKYKGKPIDLLINNAGALGDQTAALGTLNIADFDLVMKANVFGPLAVSQAFSENVAASEQKKIVALTTGATSVTRPYARFGKNTSYFYVVSKGALNMAMKMLAADLRPKGVIVGIVQPGGVDTEMFRAFTGSEPGKGMSPHDSVDGMSKVIDTLTLANNDQIYGPTGKVAPW